MRIMKNFFLLFAAVLVGYGCQKELPIPDRPANPLVYIKVSSDSFFIKAFYGQQGLLPPNVGTVVFPQDAYEVPAVNKLAFMSAYTGINGYGDSAGTVKKNVINQYNGEFYNNNVNAQPNSRITITPIGLPRPELSSIAADSSFAYDKFFKASRQIMISILLVNGMWEHRDTATDGTITISQMSRLVLVATESVETGLATRKGVQKLANGQSETYLAFVNQRGMIMQPPKLLEAKPVVWYPRFYK